ncbi:hypothetical protein NHQ30_006912 [Ciborinia camelliae]|nr:hypothetical protein NHQ30_006912 [Ciborinia camelliae]
MSLIHRKRSGSGSLEAPPGKKQLILSFSHTPMELKDALAAADKSKAAEFATYTYKQASTYRLVILTSLATKHKRLDEVIKTQDSLLCTSAEAIDKLRLMMSKASAKVQFLTNKPKMSTEELALTVKGQKAAIEENTRMMAAQRLISRNAARARMLANAAKMIMGDHERNDLLPFFATPNSSNGCGFDFGGLPTDSDASMRRLDSTRSVKRALQRMLASGTIAHWTEVDSADIEDWTGFYAV